MTAKLRPAEEIARGMVGEIDVMMSMAGPHTCAFAIGDLFCSYEDPDIAVLQRKAAIDMLTATIEQARADGEAAVRERFAVEFDEQARRYEASFPDEYKRADGSTSPARIADLARAEGYYLCADRLRADRQPRGLAGRIRALSTRWFNSWASLGTMDHQTDAALRMCLDVLRQADRSARGCPEQMTCHELVNVLREWATNAHESTRPVFAKVADELEAIVRDGEKR